MPRRTRLHLSNVPLHLVQRGHNREPCFFCDDDYHAYLGWLGDALADTDTALHAYVLMTNHVHLLFTPRHADAVPKLTMSLGRRYVQYINRRYGRTGTLWDSRYKSSLVQTETYLLTCQRYIELNPVRARMVSDPAQYRWSSYRHNGLGEPNPRVTPHDIYQALGPTATARQHHYRELFRHALAQDAIDDIRLAFNQNQPIGDTTFLDKNASVTGISRQPRPRGRPRKPPDSP
ncbi:transposase [Polycyclovorans algicola]|uniref:transposase n=1 Tax=Polycyclovorans algicola TaxID=616992 RepID=UPI0004A77C79|nr:transposase [Polycyclovorans algicola]